LRASSNDGTVGGMAPLRFRVGSILTRSAAVLARNLPAFLLLALLVAAPLALALLARGNPIAGVKPAVASRGLNGYWIALSIGSALVGLALSGVVAHGVVATLDGKRPSLPAAVAGGLRGLVPALGASLLVALCVVLGLVAWLVPGLFVLCALYVAAPVAAIERLAPTAALVRSAALTAGQRLRALALIAVVAAVQTGAALILARLVVAHTRAGTARIPIAAGWTTYVAITLGVAVVAQLFGAVARAVGYAALRGEPSA